MDDLSASVDDLFDPMPQPVSPPLGARSTANISDVELKKRKKAKSDCESRYKTAFRKKRILVEVKAFVHNTGYNDMNSSQLAEDMYTEHFKGVTYTADERQSVRTTLYNVYGRGKFTTPEVTEIDPPVADIAAGHGGKPTRPVFFSKKDLKKKKRDRDSPEMTKTGHRAKKQKKSEIEIEQPSPDSDEDHTIKPVIITLPAIVAAIASIPITIPASASVPVPVPAAAAVYVQPTEDEEINTEFDARRASYEDMKDMTPAERTMMLEDLELERTVEICKMSERKALADAKEAEFEVEMRAAELKAAENILATAKALISEATRMRVHAESNRADTVSAREVCKFCCQTTQVLWKLTYTCKHVVCSTCFMHTVHNYMNKTKTGDLIRCPFCVEEPAQPAIEPFSIAETIPVAARGCIDPYLFLTCLKTAKDMTPILVTMGNSLLRGFTAHQLTPAFLIDPESAVTPENTTATCPECKQIVWGVCNARLGAARCTNPNCLIIFCKACKDPYHEGFSCHEHQANRETASAVNGPDESAVEIMTTTKQCPRCNTRASHFKYHGCTSVACTFCSLVWCYHCLAFGAHIHAANCQIGTCSDNCDCSVCTSCVVGMPCEGCSGCPSCMEGPFKTKK